MAECWAGLVCDVTWRQGDALAVKERTREQRRGVPCRNASRPAHGCAKGCGRLRGRVALRLESGGSFWNGQYLNLV